MKVDMILGPLLDRMDQREELYSSSVSYSDALESLEELARRVGVVLRIFSFYNEGDIARHIANTDAEGILINPGAYTHTSIVIRDALSMRKLPFVEFHFSNIFARENFRKVSYISEIADGIVVGLGSATYKVAFVSLLEVLNIDTLNQIVNIEEQMK